MPADPRRVKDLFVAALDLGDDAVRRSFLDRECGEDTELRQRLDRLLEAHDQPNPAIELPANEPPFDDTESYVRTPTDPRVETIIAGRYKLLQCIGEGGMGAVWMADQIEPVKRRVAVKLIKEGMDTGQVLARFEAERQALALMDHPNIAKVLDAGTTENGRPFFVMELVKGIPITQFCDEHRLSVPDRLGLFRQVCSAVQHAHQKGIIHRDLKPTNILVESHDGLPVPKVIDFGLAKAISGVALTERTLFTMMGAVAGTPLYMAPEQATFNALDVDTRADIYALGVILYELLTGSTPIRRETFRKAALDEMLRVIREQEPQSPSHRLSTSDALPSIAATRQSEPARLGRFVRGELDWIVMKALSKERDRRYESATAFAQDLERFLNHEPVAAGPPTARYRLRKFLRRHKGPVAAATGMLGLLIAGLVVSTLLAIWAFRAEKDATERGEAAIKAGNELREARDELRSSLYGARSNLIQSAWEAHNVVRVRELLNEQRPRGDEPDQRGFEWYYWDRRANAELFVGTTAPEFERARVSRRILSPDGRRHAILWGGGINTHSTIEVRDALSGVSLFSVNIPAPGKETTVFGLSYTPDSEALFVAGASYGPKSQIVKAHWWLFDAASGKELVPHQEAPCEMHELIDLGTDRNLLAAPVPAAGPAKGLRLKLLALATGKELRVCEGIFEALHIVAFRPDGKEVAAAVTPTASKKDWAIKVWDTATGKERLSLPIPPDTGRGLTWSPDGKRLAVGSRGLRIWDAADGRELLALTDQEDWHESVHFSPDGTRLACVDVFAPARFVKLRDAATGQVRATYKLTEEQVYGLAFSPDGKRLVTLSRFGTVRTWDATTTELPKELPFPKGIALDPVNFSHVAVGADGARIAVVGATDKGETAFLQVWDHTGKSLLTLRRPCPRDPRPTFNALHSVALSPNGRRAAWVFGLAGDPNDPKVPAGAQLIVLDVPSGKELWSQALDRHSRAFWFTLDGRRLVNLFPSIPPGGKQHHDAVRFLDVESGREVHSIPTGLEAGSGLYLVRNGNRLLGLVLPWGSGGEVSIPFKVWDLRSETEAATGTYPSALLESSGMVGIALSPEGTRLAIACRPFDSLDGLVRLFDIPSGRELSTLKGLDPFIGSLAFNLDGTRLAAVGRSVKIWDPATGQELIALRDLPGGIGHLEFSRDGQRLRAIVWTGKNYAVKTWDATPRAEAMKP